MAQVKSSIRTSLNNFGLKTKLLLIILLYHFHSNAQSNAGCGEWKSKYTSGHYAMYVRECDYSPIREVKIQNTFDLKGDLKHLGDVVGAVETSKKITPSCAEARLIKAIDNNTSLQYFRYVMPVGVKDRDMVCKVTTIATDSTYTFISETVDTNIVAPRADAIRIKKARTDILFKKKPGEKIEMTYFAFADPNGNIPSWLINLLARTQVHTSIVKLVKLINE